MRRQQQEAPVLLQSGQSLFPRLKAAATPTAGTFCGECWKVALLAIEYTLLFLCVAALAARSWRSYFCLLAARLNTVNLCLVSSVVAQ